MDSPKQGATNIPFGATTFIDNQLSINAPALGFAMLENILMILLKVFLNKVVWKYL
jgi:hypothetical protein